MISSDPWPHTHYDVLRYIHTQYDRQIASGKYRPVIFPWDTLGGLVVIAYMLVSHQNRPWLRKARFLVFGFNLGHTIYLIRNVRAKGVASSLGIGLIAAWSTIYTMAMIVCNDPQRDFMRIERMEGVFSKSSPTNTQDSDVNGSATKSEENNGTLNGVTGVHEKLGPTQRHGEFAWQPFPLTPFVERLDWVLDLFGNFRGAGWNWRTISTTPPPKPIQEQLHRNTPNPPPHTFRTHISQTHVYPTRRALFIGNLKTLLAGYLILDAIKTLSSHDPYFWGYLDRPLSPAFPSFLRESKILTHAFRLILCQFGIKWALQSIFALAPLFFAGVLGPDVIGARAEPWMYPVTCGPYTLVLDQGLAGWWSGWWHQTFRFAFEQPSKKIIEMMGWSAKGKGARALQLGVAFGLSGCLHAAGSVTAHGETFPIRGQIAFFLLQAAGVFWESVVRAGLRGSGVGRGVPKWVKRGVTFVYVHVWFYHTAHLLCDDFARGGMWMFEPVPISLFRGLGLGGEGDGWLAIEVLPMWHRGSTWFTSGITF